MATITDFEQWLGIILLLNPEPEEIYALYQCVSEEESNEHFKISEKNGQLFVKGIIDTDWLRIASKKAKEAFLNMLNYRVCPGNDIESWHACQEAIYKSNKRD